MGLCTYHEKRPNSKLVTITGLSGLEPITFGQTYFLDSWSNTHVASDSNAPVNGIGFRNKVAASAVLSMNIGGTFAPGKPIR
jgi:hypothetical protein